MNFVMYPYFSNWKCQELEEDLTVADQCQFWLEGVFLVMFFDSINFAYVNI